MQYFIGGVAAWMTVPFMVACLVVLFKRFRSRERFVQVSQFLLWGFFVFQWVMGTATEMVTTSLGTIFLQTLIASALLLLIAYLDKTLLWLKKEII